MILHIARRELRAYLHSPFVWMVAAAFLFIGGIFFSIVLDTFATLSAQGSQYGEQGIGLMVGLVEPFVGTLGLLIVLFMPLLTMGLLASEEREGSLALLLSSPVRSFEIVLGKWLGLMGLLSVIFGVGFIYLPVGLFLFADPPLAPLFSAALGVAALCASTGAVGLFCSALSRSQLVAAVLAWQLLLGMWVISFLETMDGGLAQVGRKLGLLLHYQPFGQALIRGEDLTFFVLLTFLGLFAAQQRVESHRWS